MRLADQSSDVPDYMGIERAIYLDHQATTPVAAAVLAAMKPYAVDDFGNAHSSDHAFGWRAAKAVLQAKEQVANLIGSDPDEIFFTSGATESNNLALLGFARRAASGCRHRILVGAVEHKSVLGAVRAIKDQLGFTVEYLPVDDKGGISESTIEQAVADDVVLVSIMAVNNEIGTIQDIKRIGTLVRSSGAVFHCDAAQAPYAADLNSISRSVDFLSLSAHKMHGPKGIGALFVRRELQGRVEPLVYGGGQQSNLRSGTVPVALCVGLGAASEMVGSRDFAEKRALLKVRRDRFVSKMLSLPWPIRLNGPGLERRHVGNANLCFERFSAHEILGALQPLVAASTGSACTSGITEPSHVLKAIGLSTCDAESSIRFSLGLDTTDDDVDRTVQLIRQVLSDIPTIDE
jgi:cysteine desulfurase